MTNRIIQLTCMLMLFQTCNKESNPDLIAKLDFLEIKTGIKSSYFVKAAIINNSDKGYFLSEFKRIFPLLIKDSKGKDCKRKYLREEAFELTEQTNDSLYESIKHETKNTNQVIESLVEDQFIKQRIIYFRHHRDSIFNLALKSSLRGLYRDMLLLEPKDTIEMYFRINSLVNKNEKYSIAFYYRNKIHLPVYLGKIFSYEHIEGRDGSYFVIYFPHFPKRINGYYLYRKRLKGNVIYVS